MRLSALRYEAVEPRRQGDREEYMANIKIRNRVSLCLPASVAQLPHTSHLITSHLILFNNPQLRIIEHDLFLPVMFEMNGGYRIVRGAFHF